MTQLNNSKFDKTKIKYDQTKKNGQKKLNCKKKLITLNCEEEKKLKKLNSDKTQKLKLWKN